MNKEEQLSRHQQLLIAWAVKDLGESLSERDARSTRRKCQAAMRNLRELDASFEPNEVELTERECELSAFLHTMLRKGEDSGASSILYRMVSQGQAKNIWYKFIKKALAARRVPNIEDLNSDNFEDMTMHFLLYDWVQTGNFKRHMETFRKSLDESKT
jgi:hypothetical protein